MKMPFGRFKGSRLVDLPEPYLLWFVDRGFPAGRLGDLMQKSLEIKINGLESLLAPLKTEADQHHDQKPDGPLVKPEDSEPDDAAG